MPALDQDVRAMAEKLGELARGAYQRGWALGTSGNFSAVSAAEPLRLLITPSGVDKGAVPGGDMVEVDAGGGLVGGPGAAKGRPSAETSLHVAVVRARGAGAVSHTHSVWSTLLSDRAAAAGGLAIEGYEMLK